MTVADRRWLAFTVVALAAGFTTGCGDQGATDAGTGRSATVADDAPAVTEKAVERFRALRTRGGRLVDCPPIEGIAHSGEDAVRGGCALRFRSDDMVLLVRGPFGDLDAARCRFDLVLNAASNVSSVVADQIEFGGPGLCGEVRRCADGETGLRYPWQGSKLTGPSSPAVDMNVDICVNTPLGRARGLLYFRLARRGGRLVATPYAYPIGDSRVRFEGAWDVEPDGFELRRASPTASFPGS